MFAYCSKFGHPAIFFTVTPEDHCNLRIKIMKFSKIAKLEKSIYAVTEEDILEELKTCGETRIKYPGMCALDFRNIFHLIIRDVLGWNSKDKPANIGAFGRLNAYALWRC
jgi:hypothetical protein